MVKVTGSLSMNNKSEIQTKICSAPTSDLFLKLPQVIPVSILLYHYMSSFNIQIFCYFILFFKFFFLFIFLKNFILLLNFTILYWFCHISKWIRHRHTRVPHPEPSCLLPPHTIPLGRPSAPAPSTHYRASNLDWWLVSYMILYMFQCHSPKSSHPHPHPESKRQFYTSVSLLRSRTQGYCYHLSKFHIYALVYCIGVFLSGLLHSVYRLQLHPPH